MRRSLQIFVIVFILVSSASFAFAKSQDIVKMNSDIEISKDMVANDVVAIGGNVTVAGKVEGSVVVVGGSAILKPKAYVAQEVVVVGGDIVKDPTAQIEGKTTQIYVPHFIPSFNSILKGRWLFLWTAVSTLMLLGFLGLTIVVVALIPEHMGTIVNALEHSFIVMLLWGILWMVLIVPIAILLAISIIGIALIPLEILLAILAMIIGYIASAVFIGKSVLLSFRKVSLPFIDAILGILILFVVGFVPVLGPVLKVLFLIAGFGAVLTTRFGTIK